MGVPLVATNDAHYLNRADAEAHDVLLCVNTAALRADTRSAAHLAPDHHSHFLVQSTVVQVGYQCVNRTIQLRTHNAQALENVIVMGVHTNMCVIDRSFGIPALLSYGFEVVLVRDLTDAMYDPGRSPYVSHREGTNLMVGYIEAFLAPTTTSEEVTVSFPVPASA